MIYVDYSYLRKSDGKTCSATAQFDTPKKAVRFIYSLPSRNMVMESITADDEEELYAVLNKI